MCKEARRFLNRLQKLDRMIINKQIELEQWRSIATGTAPQTSTDRVQSSGSQQKVADAVCRYVDIEREITEYIDRLVDARREVIAVIEQLDVDEYDLLHKMYVQYITLSEAAEQMGKSYTWATSTHGRALKNVRDIIGREHV